MKDWLRKLGDWIAKQPWATVALIALALVLPPVTWCLVSFVLPFRQPNPPSCCYLQS